MDYVETSEEVQELSLDTAKKGVIYIGGEIATSVVTLILLIFLARFLQPSLFGLYAIAIAFNAILGIASNFGVGTTFRTLIPKMKMEKEKEKIDEMLCNGYFVALVLALLLTIAGMIASPYIANNIYHNSALVLPLELASIAEFFTVLFNLSQGAMVGLGLVKEATIANGVYSVLYLVGSVVLVLLGYGVTGAVAGLVVGLVLASVPSIYYIVKDTKLKLTGLRKQVMKKVTEFSVPIVTSYVATQGAQQFSVLLLGVYAAATVVGNYGAAFKLARIIEIVTTAITFILLGAFAEALAKRQTSKKIGEIYNGSLYYSALFLFPLIAYAISVAQPISNLLFSSIYTTAPLYFAVIAFGMALGLIALYAGTLIISSGNPKKFMKYQVSAVIIQIVLLLVLTPLYQAIGVLIALYLITPILLNILYMKALEDQFKFKHAFGQLIKITILSVVIGLFLYYAARAMHESGWTLVLNAVLMVAVFPPLAAWTKTVTKANLEFIKHTGARLKQLKTIIDLLVGYTYIFVRE